MEPNNSLMLLLLLAFVTVGNTQIECNYEIHICVDVSWSVCEVGCDGASPGTCPDHCRAHYKKGLESAAQLYVATNAVRDTTLTDSLPCRIAAYSTTATILPTVSGVSGKQGYHVAQSILDLEKAFQNSGISGTPDVSYGGTNVHTCLEILETYTTDPDINYLLLCMTDGKILEDATIPAQEAKDRIQGFLPKYSSASVVVVGTDSQGISESEEVYGPENTHVASTWDELRDLVISLTPSLCPYCGDGVKNINETCDDGNMNDLDSCNNKCQNQTPIVDTQTAMNLEESVEDDDNDLLWLLLLLLLIPCCLLIFCLAARKKGEVAAEMDQNFDGDWDHCDANVAVTEPVMAIAPGAADENLNYA